MISHVQNINYTARLPLTPIVHRPILCSSVAGFLPREDQEKETSGYSSLGGPRERERENTATINKGRKQHGMPYLSRRKCQEENRNLQKKNCITETRGKERVTRRWYISYVQMKEQGRQDCERKVQSHEKHAEVRVTDS